MKKANKQTLAIVILAILLLLVHSGFSQNATKDAQGNYKALTADNDSSKATATGKTYTDSKGTVYPVFLSVKGKLFVRRISKASGKAYNMTLKIAER